MHAAKIPRNGPGSYRKCLSGCAEELLDSWRGRSGGVAERVDRDLVTAAAV
jgi:hypothetical protein